MRHDEKVSDNFFILDFSTVCLTNSLSLTLSRKVTLKRKDDRLEACDIIQQEAKKLENVFLCLSHAATPKKVESIVAEGTCC